MDFISVAIALSSFVQQLGSVLGVATAGTMFTAFLSIYLRQEVPSVDPAFIANNPQNVKLLPLEVRQGAIDAYVRALRASWWLAVAFAVIALVASLFIKEYNIGRSSAEMKRDAKREAIMVAEV